MPTPKKPTKLKVLQGTYRKDRANANEPVPDTTIPSPPDHLTQEASVEWGRISHQLYKLGLLSDLDRSALAAYCQVYGRWVKAERELALTGNLLDTTPNGMKQQHALVGIANKAMELMHKFLIEFGLTPASRTKVSAKQSEEKPSGFGKMKKNG